MKEEHEAEACVQSANGARKKRRKPRPPSQIQHNVDEPKRCSKAMLHACRQTKATRALEEEQVCVWA